MSVRVATFKKLHPTESYAGSVMEIQDWASGLADLRIEFGAQRSFRLDPRCTQRPKLEGIVIANAWIDLKLKPALYLYPFPSLKYSDQLKHEFLQTVLAEVKTWLERHLETRGDALIGYETIVIELKGNQFKLHRLRYL